METFWFWSSDFDSVAQMTQLCGCLPFTKRLRKIRLELKGTWPVFGASFQLKISGTTRTMEHLKRSCFVFHFFKTIWWPTSVTAKPKTSKQKQKPHGKTKNLTAKPNTSQQKQNSFGFAVGICFCHEVFGFCCEVFGFGREVFGFAVRFLVLS